LRDQGWLRLAGRDRRDFLQRLSTNDFRRLAPGGGLPTVLCSATGRVIALLTVYAAEAVLWLRTPPGRAAALAGYFSRLIFWNDEVEVSDESGAVAQFGLFGPSSADLLAGLLGAGVADLPPYAWRDGEIAGVRLTVHRGGELEVAAWTLVASAASGDVLFTQLAQTAPQLTAGQVEVLRVERGIPAWGHELSDQVTPLEAGLRAAISDNKGCYTGQEVIARQLNYDKVTRRLVGLRLPADAPVMELAGAPVGGAGKRDGFIGTAVWSPALAGPIALAILPRDLSQPGTVAHIKHGDAEWAAEVAELPFTV